MIDREAIAPVWINRVSKEFRNADKILVEKTIRALLLLEGLAKQNLPFVFKGGTALMLLLSSSKRLSIDIDIIMPEKLCDLDEALENVASVQGFLRRELQQRNVNSAIDKVHYKFFYHPVYKTNKDEEFVLLDILFEKVHYKNIVPLNIQSAFLPETGPCLYVKAPSLEDITGDKLTAFAPNTTGIPYFKNMDSMSMEIIKQLYDIGNLADNVKDLGTVKTTFKKFALTELAYRGMNTLSEKDVLEDVFQTALCIATRGADGKGSFENLQTGIQRISRFIFSESYHLEKAITHASKAAYLATLIRYDAANMEKYDDPLQMRDWAICSPMNTKLNRLKQSNPEAFYYWYKIFEIKKCMT